MSESQGRNRLIVTAQSLPASLQAFPFNGVRSFWALRQQQSQGILRTMCTTMMVLATMALILRQRFSNKIQPWVPNKNRFNFFLIDLVLVCVIFWSVLEQLEKEKGLIVHSKNYIRWVHPVLNSHTYKKKKPYQEKKNVSVWEKVWKRKERLVCTIDLKLPLWLFWSLPQAAVCELSWWLQNNHVFQLFLKERWMEEKIAELLSSWLLIDSKCNLPSPGTTYTLLKQSQTNGTWWWHHEHKNIWNNRIWEKSEPHLLKILLKKLIKYVYIFNITTHPSIQQSIPVI